MLCWECVARTQHAHAACERIAWMYRLSPLQSTMLILFAYPGPDRPGYLFIRTLYCTASPSSKRVRSQTKFVAQLDDRGGEGNGDDDEPIRAGSSAHTSAGPRETIIKGTEGRIRCSCAHSNRYAADSWGWEAARCMPDRLETSPVLSTRHRSAADVGRCIVPGNIG